jgi:uncharacterized protein with GYD domain
MGTYVSLINWTDQGVKSVGATVERANQAEAAMAALGVTLKSILWTVGPYDIITIYDAEDDESATAALLALGSGGNIRSTTMRAFDADDMARILAKLG